MSKPAILVCAYHDVGYECLEALLRRGDNVLALLTHEDDPGEHVWFRPAARLARAHGLPVYTPATVNNKEWVERIRAWRPDLLFSFYYRNMICQEILQIPRLGALNMHGSLLPKYRGRAPINWAVLHGETQTGATLHHMVRRADAGDIVDQQAVPIGPEDTAQQVFARVTQAARAVLERQADALLQGQAPRRPQDESQATYYGGRKPEDGRIDWAQDARAIFNLIRAVTHPYPGAYTEADGQRLYIWWARPVVGRGVPGEVLSLAPLRIAAGEGALEISRCQWPEAPEQATAPGLRLGTILGGVRAAAVKSSS